MTDSQDENIAPDPSPGANDVTTAQESSPSAPDVQASESSTDDGAAGTGSPPVESEKAEVDGKSARETLIAQLTGEAEDEETEVEAPGTEKQEETPVSGTSESKSSEIEKPAAAASTGQVEPASVTEEELTTAPKDVKPKQKRQWDRLVADRKAKIDELAQIKPMAEYGQNLLEVCAEAKMTPPTLGAWLALGAEVHKEPNKMPLRLFAEAERLAKEMGVQLPVQKTVEVQIPEGLEDMLLEDVAGMEMSKDVAKKYLDKFRALRTAKPPTPPAPSQQQQPVQLQQQATTTPQATQAQIDSQVAQRVATAEIERLHSEYEKQYPSDWKKLREVVKEEMKQYRGTDPSRWPAFFKREVEAAKTKLGTALKKPPTITQTVRPTNVAASNKTLTERQKLMQELAGRQN